MRRNICNTYSIKRELSNPAGVVCCTQENKTKPGFQHIAEQISILKGQNFSFSPIIGHTAPDEDGETRIYTAAANRHRENALA